MKTSQLTLALAAVGTLLTAGCATTPAEAPRKTMSVEEISRQWKQGNDLVLKGEEQKRRAQSKLEAANQETKEADSLMARGKGLMLESEQAFRDTSRTATRAPPR